MNRKLWMILVAIWFALWGLVSFGVQFKYSDLIMGVLAFAVAISMFVEFANSNPKQS